MTAVSVCVGGAVTDGNRQIRHHLVQPGISWPAAHDLGLVGGFLLDHVPGAFPRRTELVHANRRRTVSQTKPLPAPPMVLATGN